MNDTELKRILERIDPSIECRVTSFTRFKHEEDDGLYDVWKVETPDASFVLKCANECEFEAYKSFFEANPCYAPKLFGTTAYDGKNFILIEYIDGENLVRCRRESLRAALDALIKMQSDYWENAEFASCCQSFDKALAHCQNRAKYLFDAELERVYAEFLRIYQEIPRTLCHNDLLPFNVIVENEKRAAFIDWEVCGILPYPASLARLLAHGTDDGSSMFELAGSDREFAIRYYYDGLLAGKGIEYEEYRKTLAYFLFYEYCEWVYVGNRYDATDGDNYKRYFKLAKAAAELLLQKT